jgi:signal transduction histidine kinase
MASLGRTLLWPTLLMAALAAGALAFLGLDLALHASRLERQIDDVRQANAVVLEFNRIIDERNQAVVIQVLRPDERQLERIRLLEEEAARLLPSVERGMREPRGGVLFAQLAASLDERARARGELLAATAAGDADRRARALTRWHLAVGISHALLDDVQGWGLRRLDRTVKDAQERRTRSFAVLVALLAASAGVAAVYSLWVGRRVVRPLQRIASTAGQIGRRGEPAEVPGADRDDEIGVVARALGEATRDLVAANARLAEGVRMRDEFLSIASHELKTPLTPLKLHLENSARRQPGPPPRWLVACQRQVERLEALVAQLLDVTRIRAGRLTLRPGEVDLGALVESVAERWSPEAQAVGSAVTVDVEPGVVGRWDGDRLDQVLANLLSNALRHAPGTPVAIRVRRHRAVARLTVEDGGPGLPAALRPRLFERFERAGDARNVGGLGLGLYIVRHLVEAHGGRVWADPGTAGATFHVELPLPGAAAPEPAAAAADGARAAPEPLPEAPPLRRDRGEGSA